MTREEILSSKITINEFKKIETMNDYYKIDDSYSSLDRIRFYQLSELLGKYKIF